MIAAKVNSSSEARCRRERRPLALDLTRVYSVTCRIEAEKPPLLHDDAESSVEVAVENDVEHYHFRISKNLTRRIDQYLVDRVAISRVTACSG